VEPTNNSAERALRCAVQWRKITFGSRSAQGEIAVARLLTVNPYLPPAESRAARLPRHRHPVTQARPSCTFPAENGFNHLNCHEKGKGSGAAKARP